MSQQTQPTSNNQPNQPNTPTNATNPTNPTNPTNTTQPPANTTSNQQPASSLALSTIDILALQESLRVSMQNIQSALTTLTNLTQPKTGGKKSLTKYNISMKTELEKLKKKDSKIEHKARSKMQLKTKKNTK